MPSSVPNLDQLLQQAGLSTEVPPSLGEWQNLLWRVRAALDRGRDAAQATGWAQHLLDKLSLPVLVLDRQGTVIHASEACGALGWSHDLRGRPLAELLSSPLEDLRLSNLLKRVWQGERLHQVPLSLRHTEGRLQLAEASLLPLHAASGESTAAYVAMSITTTELHGQSDDNARTDRQYFYESLLAALPASLAVLGPDQRYRFCNPAAIGNPQIREWIMGHTDAEYVAERGFPPELATERGRHMDEAARERKTVQFEERMLRPDGEPVYQLRNYTPLFDENGELLLYLGHGVDVTELRRTQEALRELNAQLEERVEARTAELEALSRQLQHDALHDSLTGLPNRALFSDRLSQAIARSKLPGGPQYAVLFLDVDRFKGINDTLGHPTGDAMLVEMARRLRACLRATDTVARLGGDEFTILLEPLQSTEQAAQVAARIQDALRRPMQMPAAGPGGLPGGWHQVTMSASLGIVHSQPDYDSAMAVLRDADIAMYRAKDGGRAKYRVFTPEMREHILHVNRMEHELRRALAADELRVRYQPVLDLDRGRIEGFEALVRWQHPERGLLGPDDFTPIAEESGLLPDIDRWVLARACRELVQWQRLYPHDPPLHLSVNFCSQHLAAPDVHERVKELLQRTGFDPGRLNLEITESSLLSQTGDVQRNMERLRQLGVRLHLDDFGTGYSSLSYLQLYPIDVLKIDRSFVQGMLDNDSNAELVRTIVAMAKNLNLKVVAEGIEDPRQLAALRGLGCDAGQGFLFSPALDVHAARTLVAEGQHHRRPGWRYDDLPPA
ncbi:putative bifunctional diguanylate cyclase/phosphodiesterase [Deinococcus radiodurans]|jgi:PAS domain S-box/diguanylate cyclase (GGDEF) domain|nr:GGDEF and EAL domain-containing protein [Deinococcus radiodurans]QIP28646.1 EAL domain-containing protein [Deinococcus radiodurans]QIP32646.1 EAL domain-containing protein [Deinococcus radiodurans]UID69470.1 diguanylate cyclase [Deinococcus radiodurans R1 = ATCC 13939 = DSM 20539]UTA50045.1 EAL domain-containing protein [Deinococcus radiodurans]